MTTTEETAIPSSDDVKAPSSGGKSWRIASGKICRGKEGEDGYETRPDIIGRLRRIGIHEGQHEGERKRYLECDIETSSGKIRLHANLLNKKGVEEASGVAIAIAYGLTHIEKDTDLIITAFLGNKKNSYGSFPTFVNFYTLAPGATQGKAIPKREWNKDSNMDKDFAALVAKLQAHPAWADRPQSEARDPDGDPKTHLAALCDECAAKGWPTPEQAPGPWLGMMAKAYKLDAPKSSLSSHSDDEWGAIRQGLLKVEKMPEALAQATQTVGAQTAAQAPTQPDLAGIV